MRLRRSLDGTSRRFTAAVLFLATGFMARAAYATHSAPLTDRTALDWSLVVAAVLCLVHVSGPHIRGAVTGRESTLGSFGSGMAVAYVFIHLLSELDKGHQLIGDRIHLITLLGFVAFYGAQSLVPKHVRKPAPHASTALRIFPSLAIAWLYSWLILYAMPEAIKLQGLLILPTIIALCLHLIFADHHLSTSNEKEFDTWGRWVLASAPMLGWFTDLFYFDDDPFVSDVLFALLAGAILYNTFARELGDRFPSSFRWFLGGVIVFLALSFLPSVRPSL